MPGGTTSLVKSIFERDHAGTGFRAPIDTTPQPPGPGAPHVVALDFGMKWNIARHLFDMGCRVTVLPGTATAEEVLGHEPDGVFLSNGPGDPEPVEYAQQTIRQLLGKRPIFAPQARHNN